MNPEVEHETRISLKADFEESTLPYFVDIVYYPTVEKEVREHIGRVGREIFRR